MKKLYVLLILLLTVIVLSGCGENVASDDLYIGEYISLDNNLEGTMKIIKEQEDYYICIEFEGTTEILAEGEKKDGTLFYKGEDNYGNKISGNIFSY